MIAALLALLHAGDFESGFWILVLRLYFVNFYNFHLISSAEIIFYGADYQKQKKKLFLILVVVIVTGFCCSAILSPFYFR